MTTTIEDNALALADKILSAPGQQEVRQCVDAAIKNTVAAGADSGLAESFLDRMISIMGEYDPLYRSADQWSNIKIARMHLNRLKRNLPSSIQANS